MPDWYFYRFDHLRYVELRPALRSAISPAAFAALADSSQAEGIIRALVDEEIALPQARHAFVQAACCRGEPLELDHSLPRFVGQMSATRGMEDAGQILSDLLAGGKNLESWLLPASGMSGFLTPAETQTLYLALESGSQVRGSPYARVRRTGGAAQMGQNFFRRLFDTGPQPGETFGLLLEMVAKATEREEGLAVVATE